MSSGEDVIGGSERHSTTLSSGLEHMVFRFLAHHRYTIGMVMIRRRKLLVQMTTERATVVVQAHQIFQLGQKRTKWRMVNVPIIKFSDSGNRCVRRVSGFQECLVIFLDCLVAKDCIMQLVQIHAGIGQARYIALSVARNKLRRQHCCSVIFLEL